MVSEGFLAAVLGPRLKSAFCEANCNRQSCQKSFQNHPNDVMRARFLRIRWSKIKLKLKMQRAPCLISLERSLLYTQN